MKKVSRKTLRTDPFSELGVSIEAIDLRCESCGETCQTPVPLASGNFPRDWYKCIRGCHSKAA